ncbi:MAG: ABC transporter ATP-binding protein [Clostridia bacterium]|nr:ABC transporter ATP-binding protein [Clostridia bacterium]
MIKLQNIKKIYGERTVLNIDGLSFTKGETVAIVGPNGSGKSTLLKIIAGVIKSDEGTVETNSRMYYLPQQNIPFRKSVRKNILISMENADDKEIRCNEILAELGLANLADKNAKGLSGGECQRLALGRVLINEGDFLVLDEPSSAADIEGTEMIENAIRKYKDKTGCGVIMTTHSPVQALKLAERVIMLCDGKIVEDGRPEELLINPKTQWGKKFISKWKL